MIDTIAKRLAVLSSRDLRQVTSEMAWIYRRQRIDAAFTLSSHILTHVGETLPSERDWAAIRKLVIGLRTKARLEANAEKAARLRIQRQRYMRVYMKDYRQKRALAALKGSVP
jgi:hypothetical protein